MEDIISFFAPQPIRTYGNIGFLVVDVIVLALKLLDMIVQRIQARKGANAVGAPAPPVAYLLIVIHLVLGSLMLSYGSDGGYRIVTLLCWGPFLIAMVVGELRKLREIREKEQVTDAENKETETADTEETVPESAHSDKEQFAIEQGRVGASQNESQEAGRERRGLRRRG